MGSEHSLGAADDPLRALCDGAADVACRDVISKDALDATESIAVVSLLYFKCCGHGTKQSWSLETGIIYIIDKFDGDSCITCFTLDNEQY